MSSTTILSCWLQSALLWPSTSFLTGSSLKFKKIRSAYEMKVAHLPVLVLRNKFFSKFLGQVHGLSYSMNGLFGVISRQVEQTSFKLEILVFNF